MPALQLVTNVKVADERAFILEFSKLGSVVTSYPEKLISVDLQYNPNLSFAGTFEPAFLLTILTLPITPESNQKNSKILFDFLKEKLDAPDDRGYIHFKDPGLDNLGVKSTTLAVMFGATAAI